MTRHALCDCCKAVFGIVHVNGLSGSEQTYPTNKYGETYGAVIYGSGEELDLVAVVTTNGKEGYIKNSDVNKYAGDNANTPGEAMEYMSHREGVGVGFVDGDINILYKK